MKIPLDRLYHYLNDICNTSNIVIYRCYPHGSKNIKDDCRPLLNYTSFTWFDLVTTPIMICYDQEPLDATIYQCAQLSDKLLPFPESFSPELRQEFITDMWNRLNLKFFLPGEFFNGYDKWLLCHSEKNSADIAYYQDRGWEGVYYWCHALIARDWFRYAELDPALVPNFDSFTKDFLIYNRSWGGSREYRLKFVELLVQNDLVDSCNTKFSPIDEGIHYLDHVFVNPDFQVTTDNLDSLIPLNTAEPDSSADYSTDDYRWSGIEVVLETIFDNTKQFLTEKILRPISCGRPFILASTPGSLQYLRDYGFETFDGLIDETYDTIADPLQRLQAIINEMQRIKSLPVDDKNALWTQLYAIAERNKARFHSEEFGQSVVDEFKTNFDNALVKSLASRSGSHMTYFKTEWLAKYPEFEENYNNKTHRTAEELERFQSWINGS